MEDIHGVDVSWTHHSPPTARKSLPRTAPAPTAAITSPKPSAPANVSRRPVPAQHDRSPASERGSSASIGDASALPAVITRNHSPPPPTPTSPPPPGHSPAKKAGGLLRRNSKEINAHHGLQGDVHSKGGRRSGWMASLSSKLSSQPASTQPQSSAINANGQIAQTPPGAALQRTVSSPTGNGKNGYFDDMGSPLTKTGSNNFFSSALKRLSSNSQVTPVGKLNPNGTTCARCVLNVDPNRQRCLLPELDASKLRRVAFCVDVEIAGGPRYKDQNSDTHKGTNQDKKIKEQAEGNALKNPAAMLKQKEDSEAHNKPDDSLEENGTEPKTEEKQMTRKKEKKRKSEEERKERNEQKRRKAEANGSIPMIYTRDTEQQSTDNTQISTRPKSASRPTIDPLRIYRRCCQLRETPVLRRISEQLAAAASSSDNEPGTVFCLNLTGSRLQNADIATLSDWLAIVPVHKLILEDSDLNDEGVRVILAGLLAAGTHDFSRVKANIRREERTGIIEKLSLKNNPRISKQGWKHISLFIYMCRSLKTLDLSMLKFPSSPAVSQPSPGAEGPEDIAEIFAKALSERYGGNHLEELLLSDCGLATHQIRKIVDAIMMCGVVRLGLARNDIDVEALGYLAHYLRSGMCHGLDLGGNNLRDRLDILGDAFEVNDTTWALALADCNLDLPSLKSLFPGILNLHNLRFLDLSYNPELFNHDPCALPLLRKYIPMIKMLRRIHLTNCEMSPAQAISLADVVSEGSQLAHLNILGNTRLAALAAATDEDSQEEAVALYASLMSACRVSQTLISIEIEVPSEDNSEIVKALAKQMVAYSLINMEQWTLQDVNGGASPSTEETESLTQAPTSNSHQSSHANGGQMPHLKATKSNVKDVEVPQVLQHIVGDGGLMTPSHEGDQPAPDHDYIVSGTGVVRALNYCLTEFRKGSTSVSQSGTASPSKNPSVGARAQAVSKDLLESARKIRSRLQPALRRESKGNDDMAYRRLLFLDNTLKGIIERFEAEYPETRLPKPENVGEDGDALSREISKTSATGLHESFQSPLSPISPSKPSMDSTLLGSDSDSDGGTKSFEHQRRLSKKNSEASLAARAQVAEEGKVLRIGRKLNQPEHADEATEEEHVRVLREKLRALNAHEDN